MDKMDRCMWCMGEAIMRYLIALLLLVSSSVQSAGVELVIPAWTHHIVYKEDVKPYTEGFDNRGIGINLNLEDRMDVGFVVMTKDSVEEQAIYAYGIGYTDTPIQFGGGLTFIVKSKQDPQQAEYEKTQSAIVIPIFAIRYGWVRLTTTFPLGELVDAKIDLINVQLMIPLGGK